MSLAIAVHNFEHLQEDLCTINVVICKLISAATHAFTHEKYLQLVKDVGLSVAAEAVQELETRNSVLTQDVTILRAVPTKVNGGTAVGIEIYICVICCKLLSLLREFDGKRLKPFEVVQKRQT